MALEGQLTISSQKDPTSPIVVDGWVEYKVKGEKPGVMKAAPDFLIDKTIEFIQVSHY